MRGCGADEVKTCVWRGVFGEGERGFAPQVVTTRSVSGGRALPMGNSSCASLPNPGLPWGSLGVCLFLLDAFFSEQRA